MPKLDHIALEVSNIDKAIDFYAIKLDFSLISRAVNEEQQEEYCFLESEGTSLELITDLRKNYKTKKKVERPYCPHICFATDNMEETVKDILAKDIKIIHGPMKIKDEETWVYFSDPDGNVLEYIHWYK